MGGAEGIATATTDFGPLPPPLRRFSGFRLRLPRPEPVRSYDLLLMGQAGTDITRSKVSPDFLCQTMDIRAKSVSSPLAVKRIVCVLTCAGSLL
jgi:hypothetical protein